MQNTQKFDVHPFAEIFPLMSESEFDHLVEDIRQNGQLEEIIVHGGRIIDGRNRFQACQVLNREPRWREWNESEGGSIISFIISKNLQRRHLNESQRAMVAARFANMKKGYNKTSEPDEEEDAFIEPESNAQIRALVSQSEAAELLNVSRTNVQAATRVLNNAVEEVITAVEQGELAVSAAAEAVKELPKGKQMRLIRKGRKAHKKLTEILRVNKAVQTHKENGAACLLCNPEIEANDDEIRLHLAALKVRVPRIARFIEDILFEMDETEFLGEIQDAENKILLAIDAGRHELRMMQKFTRLNWDVFNAALANLLQYGSIEVYQQGGKSESARGRVKTLYRRAEAKPKEEKQSSSARPTEEFLPLPPGAKPSAGYLSQKELEERVLACVDNWICTESHIQKRIGKQDVSDAIEALLDTGILVQKMNETMTAYFRPGRVPAKFWSTGEDRIGFEMPEDSTLPKGTIDHTENYLAA